MQSLVKVDEVTPEKLAKYDLIGFGSGIYGYKHHKELIEFIEKMSSINKNVFIFSTSGNYRERHHDLIKEKLTGKGCKIVGEFTCFGEFRPLGFNLNVGGPLAFIFGKNKGHPDEKELENARKFVKSLMNE
ncbi:MAG: flavodoxin domain-containing protein [Methanobacterium sp.]